MQRFCIYLISFFLLDCFLQGLPLQFYFIFLNLPSSFLLLLLWLFFFLDLQSENLLLSCNPVSF